MTYQTQLSAYQETLLLERRQANRCESRWSWLRLLSFMGGVVVVVFLTGRPWVALLMAVVAVMVFLATVYRHGYWLRLRTLADWQLLVLEESLLAMAAEDLPIRSGQRPPDRFQVTAALPLLFDAGVTWKLTEQEQDDLDLYGEPVGLFGLLNRTSTKVGARRLRSMLETLCLEPKTIRARQDAVQWLADHWRTRHQLLGSALPLRKQQGALDELVVLLNRLLPSFSYTMTCVLRLWSLVSVMLVVIGVVQFLTGQPWGRVLLLGVTLINGLAWGLLKKKRHGWRAAILPYTELITVLRGLPLHLQEMSEELPSAGYLHVLKETAEETLAKTQLVLLCDWLDWARIGGLLRSVLNLYAFYDLHMAQAIILRLAPGQAALSRALAAVAELEAFNSLACFAAQLPVASYPQLEVESQIKIEEGYHPLLFPGENQANTLALHTRSRTWVITGPNAAGKSTFLRMVGVNVLLAQAGSAVSARAMTWSPVRLMTDVRVRDDLAKHESYFLSEVRRLRRIVMDEQAVPPIFALIDEPFRGTNSLERTAAGVALLEHLIQTPHFVLVATHEATLTESAEQSTNASNYHFQEQLAKVGVVFDFCLRPGPTTAKTALRILAKEGYPASLLERAQRWVQEHRDGSASP